MGTFRVDCIIVNSVQRDRETLVPRMLVDTGSEYTWVPASALRKIGIATEKKDEAFVMANGRTITRPIGFAIVRFGEHFTIDEVVFGQPGDLEILGARTLEGMNLHVDPRRKRLVAGGPMPAAESGPLLVPRRPRKR